MTCRSQCHSPNGGFHQTSNTGGPPTIFSLAYNGIHSGSHLIGEELHSIVNPQPTKKHMYPHLVNTSPNMAAPSWSMQDVAFDAPYIPGTPSIGLDPTANGMLQSHILSDQDGPALSGNFDDVIDYDAFFRSFSSSQLSHISLDRPMTTSTLDSFQSPVNQAFLSPPEASSLCYSTPTAKLQSATDSTALEMTGTKATCSHNRQNCLSSALEVLRTLHVPPSACISSAGDFTTTNNQRQPRNTGAVFDANRNAVRQLSDILQCSCISATPLQLTLITICDKIIAWYRAVLQSFAGHCKETTAKRSKQELGHDHKPSTSSSVACERVVHQSFSVGNFAFDGNLESKICEQVIVSELEQLQNVVADLTNHLQGENSGGDSLLLGGNNDRPSLSIDSPESMKAVPARLCAQLNKRLHDTKAEIENHE